jgi:hypothetical protein
VESNSLWEKKGGFNGAAFPTSEDGAWLCQEALFDGRSKLQWELQIAFQKFERAY